MLSNKAAIAAVGLVALAGAAGAGAFIATQRTASVSEVSMSEPALTPGVEGTEAIVEPLPTETVEPRPTEPVEVAPSRPVTPAPAPPAPRPAARAPEAREAQATSTVARNTPPTPARPPASRTDEPPSRPAPAPIEPEPQPPSVAERVEAPVPSLESHGSEPRPSTEQAASAAPAPRFDELTVPADAVVGLQLESTISSETARVEDRVEARVTRDVRANGRVAIPSGSRVLGSVSLVERGGKMRERARLGVRFHTIVLADGTELPLQTETVYREGEAPGNASAAKVGGGAIGGAILGAILGGGKGAAIGAGVGAGAGTAAVMAGGRRHAEIRAGSPVTVKVLSPVTVTVER
jgi:type IV secretory pathway VirB10-like protein